MQCEHWERLGCKKVDEDWNCTALSEAGIKRCNATGRCHIPGAAFEVRINSQPRAGATTMRKSGRRALRRAEALL